MSDDEGAEPRPEVRFGVTLPIQPPENLRALATRIEALGLDSVWTGDHVAFHNPTLEPLTVLAHVAAITRRVRIGTCVYLLALRHPTVAAKSVATLDVLAGGRVVFGVGVGGEFSKEFEACGVPRTERGRRVDEGIAVCRLLWTKSPASFEGRFVRFTDVSLEPKPVQSGGPPVWIGGRSDHALRRAARVGDGWVSYVVTPERYRASLEKIRGFAAEAGRAITIGSDFEPAHLAFTVIDDDWERARATAARYLTRQYHQPFDELVKKYCVLGPPRQCAETLARFVEAGVRTLILGFTAGADRMPEQLERFAAEVLPHFPRAGRP
ncbi:MAG: LLM class flavin-dependent oxidoreductase [Candidatus Rokubacteria bacterium]|nr:LLM class flavin-dependent oxidoreductase [Candidatus Rokubacteria bacterium]